MTNRERFIKAHQITRATVARFGGDYRVTFAAALAQTHKKEGATKMLDKFGRRMSKKRALREGYMNSTPVILGNEKKVSTGNLIIASCGHRVSSITVMSSARGTCCANCYDKYSD